MITKEQKRRWVEALRSGKWKQAYRRIMRKQKDGTRAYCCLGVARELFDLPHHHKGMSGGLPFEFLHYSHQAKLIAMNDEERADFPRIADWIEENIDPQS